jgi:PAS domain S-box-containing protein
MYSLLGVASVILVQKVLRLPRMFTAQGIALLLGVIVLWGTSVLYVLQVIPPYVPAGPFALLGGGLILGLGLFRFRLLDLVPVARDSVIETMLDAVIVLDAQHRVVDLNPAARSLFGAQSEDALSEKITRMLACLERNNVAEYSAPCEQTGILAHYDVRSTVLYDAQQRLTGYVIVLRDVTSLKEALEQAEAADRAKSQFVSNVSHELRTPLTNIKLYIDLMARGKQERRELYMDTLRREAERLHDLIENLLNVSRLDLGKIKPQLRLLDVNALVSTLAQDRRPLFLNKGLQLDITLSKVLPEVPADAKLLEQVFTNLLSNALNYTPCGGKVSLLTTQQVMDGEDWVTFSVQDTGIGIAPEEQHRLFTRFYRGAVSRTLKNKAPGTGLGLAISKEIMDLHHGHITLQSKVEQGSTFTVWLPQATTVAAAITVAVANKIANGNHTV